VNTLYQFTQTEKYITFLSPAGRLAVTEENTNIA